MFLCGKRFSLCFPFVFPLFTSGFKRGYNNAPQFANTFVKGQIWFAIFFFVSGGIFLILCTLHSRLNLVKMPDTLLINILKLLFSRACSIDRKTVTKIPSRYLFEIHFTAPHVYLFWTILWKNKTSVMDVLYKWCF